MSDTNSPNMGVNMPEPSWDEHSKRTSNIEYNICIDYCGNNPVVHYNLIDAVDNLVRELKEINDLHCSRTVEQFDVQPLQYTLWVSESQHSKLTVTEKEVF